VSAGLERRELLRLGCSADVEDFTAKFSDVTLVFDVETTEARESGRRRSVRMTPNWEESWIHQKAVLPFSVTWKGWKVGQRGT